MAKKTTQKKTDKALGAHAPVYLVVADNTPEFKVALKFICKVAEKNNARLAILYVMEKEGEQTWLGIAKQMHEEYLNQAEAVLYEACDIIKDELGQIPTVYLEEGGRFDKVIDVINKDNSITRFVLGGDTTKSSPGPLVSYFTGKGLSSLRVPMIIVPGNIRLDAWEV
jgi:nucleotide-binding universal stress UspA family protein